MANNLPYQNNSPDHDLDRQLDRALESYLPQPRAELEQRILARAQSVTPRPVPHSVPHPVWMRPRFALLAASAVAACAVAAIFLAIPSRNAAPRHANAIASTARASQPQEAASIHHALTSLAALSIRPAPKPTVTHKPHRAAHTPAESALPRLAVFPAPAPPTPQEEELAMFATRYPKLLEEATRPIPNAKPEPITIQPIQIKPIKIAPLSVAKLNPQSNSLPHHLENAP